MTQCFGFSDHKKVQHTLPLIGPAIYTLRYLWCIFNDTHFHFGVVSISVCIHHDVRQRVYQKNVAVCAPVQQGRCVYEQPPVRVPVTVRREHPAEEAGLLKPGGLPPEHPLCSPPWVSHGWGEDCVCLFFNLPRFKVIVSHSCELT